MAADGSVIVDTRMDNNGIIRGARQFSQMVGGMKNAVKKAGHTMLGSADAYIQSLNQSTKTVKNLDAEIKRLESQATKLKRSMTGDKAFTAQYNGLIDQIKETESEIEKLQAKQQEWADMGIDPESEPFTELDNQIFDLIDRVEELKAKQAELRESGEAYTPEYANMQQDLEDLQTRLEELKAARNDVLSTPPGWNDMATVTGAIADAMNRVKTSAATALYAIQHPAESLDRLFNVIIRKGVGAFIQLAGAAARAATSIFRIAGSGALSFLKRLAEGAKNAAIQLAKLMGNAVGGGFKKLGGGIWNAVKGLFGFNNAGRQARVSIKQLLGSILSARAIIAGLKKFIGLAKESLEDFANSNPAVRASMVSLQGALNGLKGSLGSAFAPIYTAVVPALVTLINMLTAAINAIGAFMAALTGQSTYQKAVSGISGAGGAASNAGGAAHNAAEEFKDLKRELAGFDDLEVLGSDDTDSGSGGGGGGGGGAGGYTYETEEIGSGITDFVAKLKEMWANADYEGIGREIAGCINNAFEKAKEFISWDNLGDKITEVVTGITGIFNGLVDGIDWQLIGETFGEGINTILHTVNLLLTGIDWKNLGVKLMEGLNSLVNTVDWELLGDTLGQGFKSAVQLIGTALETFDWENLGTKVAEGFSALVEKINDSITSIEWGSIGSNFAQGVANLISDVDWNNLGVTIANSFNAALYTIYGAVHDFDFKSAATDIFNGLNELIVTIDWTKIGKTISDTFKGALDFIATAIETVDWKTLGEKVKTALVTIDWNGVFESLSEAIGAAAGGLASLIGGLLSEAFTNIKSYFSDSIEAAGGDVVAGVFNGILNAIKNVGSWIKTHIFDPFIKGFKSAFGIASPASTMEEPGENIILGVFQGITNALKNVGKWVKDNIFTPIWNAIKSAGETAIEITVSLVKKVGEWASDAWEAIKAGAETVVKTVKAIFTEVGTWAGNVWDAVKSGAETIVKTVKAIFTEVGTWAGNVWDAVKEGSKEIVKTVKAIFTEVGTWAGNVWDAVKEGSKEIVKTVNAIAGSAKNFVGDVWSFITSPDAVSKTVNAVFDVAQNAISDLWDSVSEAWTNFVKGKWLYVNAKATIEPEFGLDPTDPAYEDYVAKLKKLVELAMQKGEWSFPVDMTANFPEGSIEAAKQEFVEKWNKEHPEAPVWLNPDTGEIEKVKQEFKENPVEAPVDPTLPDNAGKVIEDEWAGQDIDLEAEVDTTPEADKQTWFDKLKGAGLEAPVDATLNPTNTPDIAFKTGLALKFKADMDVNSGQDANTKFKTGTALDFKARLTGQTGDSKTTTGIFGSAFNVQSRLTGQTGDSKTTTGIFGSTFNVQSKLTGKTSDSKTNAGVHGDSFHVHSKLTGKTDDSKKLTDVHGSSFDVKAKLTGKAHGSDSLSGVFGSSFDVKASLDSKSAQKIKSAATKALKGIKVTVKASGSGGNAKLTTQATGGVIANGRFRRFGAGGVISGGLARYLAGVPHYAGGTTRAHGTVFVAGEAGPEVMGHINGRTEVLNKSQLAQTMYSAVLSAMGQAVSALGTFLSGQLANCTNAIVSAIGNIGRATALHGIEYHEPVMASGSVMPYDVAAQIALTGEDIQNTLNSNTEDLIQTIISVAGQIVAAVQAQGRNQQSENTGRSLTAQQVIDDINRRAQMFGSSPVLN